MPKDTFLNLDKRKKKKIVEAAIKEFADKGYQKSSVQSIASNASISKGSIYQYFESKKEFFLYIIDLAIQIKIDYASKLIKENQNLSYFELIEKMLSTSLNYYTEYPDLYKIYQTIQNGIYEDISNEVNKKIDKLGHKFNKDLLLKALENDEVRDDLNIDLASFLVYGLLKNFGSFLVNKESLISDGDWCELVNQFIELLKNGLKVNTD